MPEYLSERAARAAMVEVGRRLYARQLVSGGEGNLSCRLGPRRILCTPTGVNKGFLGEDQLVVTDYGGEGQSLRAPSSELLLHLACYEERADCLAVVHELLCCMPEAATALGDVPTARYATPGTASVADAVRAHLGSAECVLMERHGALAMGMGPRALFDACDKMEMLEGVARVQLLASLRRMPTPLPESERRLLAEQRRAAREKLLKPPRPWERDR